MHLKAWWAIAVLATGCSLTLPDLTSGLDGVGGGGAGGGGGTDAGRDGGCALLGRDAAFCADFDFDGPVEQGWTERRDVAGGSVAFSTTHSVSGPKSLRVGFVTDAGDGHLGLLYLAPRSVTRLILNVDVRALDLGQDTSLSAAPLSMSFSDSQGQRHLYVYTNGSNSFVYVGDYPPDGGRVDDTTGMGPGLPIDQWHHLEFDLTLAGTMATLTVKRNGAKVIDQWNPKANLRPAAPELTVGIRQKNGSKEPWTFLFDNVVVHTVE